MGHQRKLQFLEKKCIFELPYDRAKTALCEPYVSFGLSSSHPPSLTRLSPKLNMSREIKRWRSTEMKLPQNKRGRINIDKAFTTISNLCVRQASLKKLFCSSWSEYVCCELWQFQNFSLNGKVNNCITCQGTILGVLRHLSSWTVLFLFLE